MKFYLCQACSPLARDRIFGSLSLKPPKDPSIFIHKRLSSCERKIRLSDAIPYEWDEIKNEHIFPSSPSITINDLRNNGYPCISCQIEDVTGALYKATNALFKKHEINILEGTISGSATSKREVMLLVSVSQKISIDDICQTLEELSITNSFVEKVIPSINTLRHLRILLKDSKNKTSEITSKMLKIKVLAEDKVGLLAAITGCIFTEFSIDVVGGMMTTASVYASTELWLKNDLNIPFKDISNTIFSINSSFRVLSVFNLSELSSYS